MPRAAAAIAALTLALAAHSLSAQRAQPPRPDLQGVWDSGTVTPLQRPSDLAGKEFFSEPEAVEYERTWLTSFGKNFPPEPPMVPNPFGGNLYQIVQTRDHVMIYTEQVHDARIIRIGGSHLPPAISLWLGDSIGRWDGNTLIVDTTNFNDKTNYSMANVLRGARAEEKQKR